MKSSSEKHEESLLRNNLGKQRYDGHRRPEIGRIGSCAIQSQQRRKISCTLRPKSCLHRMREVMTQVKLYEPVEFIYTFLKDKLVFSPIDEPIAVHITCSMRKMNLGNMLVDLARLCSTKVIVPEEVGCCGFAGDRGFTYPEVNAYALRKLKPQIEKAGVKTGYSNSRTCEIGLTRPMQEYLIFLSSI